jgi:peroxiredoxin
MESKFWPSLGKDDLQSLASSPQFVANLPPIPALDEFVCGELVPDIQGMDLRNNRLFKLSNYRHDRPVIVYFTRIFTEKIYCPLCYGHILEMNRRYGEIVAAGGEAVLIASTDDDRTRQVIRDLGLALPVISDASCSLFRRYRTGRALGAPLPAQFIIDRDGKLVYRHLFSFLEPNAAVDRLLSFL